MMLTERQKLLIEKNISGILTPEESQEMKEYQKDPEFREEVSFHEDLRQAVRLEQQDVLDDVLQKLRTQVEEDLLSEEDSAPTNEASEREMSSSTTKVRSLSPRWILAVAASLILAVSLVLFLLMDSSPSATIEHLALATLPENTQSPDDPRTKGDFDVNSSFAFEAYEQREYSEAESLFSEIPESDKSNKTLLYNAITLLILNQQNANDEYLAQAIEYLEEVSQGNSGYRLSAEWYLALAYLTDDNEARAKKLLNRISTAEHPYTTKAKELLGTLE